MEIAVSHWSDKSFYVAWTTSNVWKATARGLVIFRGVMAHRPYCVKHMSTQSMLMLGAGGKPPKKILKIARCLEIKYVAISGSRKLG